MSRGFPFTTPGRTQRHGSHLNRRGWLVDPVKIIRYTAVGIINLTYKLGGRGKYRGVSVQASTSFAQPQRVSRRYKTTISMLPYQKRGNGHRSPPPYFQHLPLCCLSPCH